MPASNDWTDARLELWIGRDYVKVIDPEANRILLMATASDPYQLSELLRIWCQQFMNGLLRGRA